MDGISCDACGAGLLIGSPVRYEVRIEVKAAYDPMDLSAEDLARNTAAEMARLAAQLRDVTEEEAMDQVYRQFKFDLCPPCQRKYLSKPINLGPTRPVPPKDPS